MLIPSARSVNYRDAEEVCAFQQLLCKLYEMAGGFSEYVSSGMDRAVIRREAELWLREVKIAIDGILRSPIQPECGDKLTLGDVPRLLSSYGLVYRLCHGGQCSAYLRETRLHAADRWVRGDRSISRAQVALMLRREASRDIRMLEKRYRDFSGRVMAGWIDDLQDFGRLRNVNLHEAYEILTFLINENLFAYIDTDKDKERWIREYTLSVSEIAAMDTKTLLAYVDFGQAADSFCGKSLDEMDERYLHLFTLLARREDLHPFFRRAVEIDLARHHIA